MKTLGRLERVRVRRTGGTKWADFNAKIDTGAKWSRIGVREAAKLKLGPIEDVRSIGTSDGGTELRPVVRASVRIGGRRVTVQFTVSTGKGGVLIGRRTLHNRFKVDVTRKYVTLP
jgi:hypothetical protein